MKQKIVYLAVLLGLISSYTTAADKPIDIVFDQAGAIYQANEPGKASIEINIPGCEKVLVEILDADRKPAVAGKSFNKKEANRFTIDYSFRLKNLGYYYLQVTAGNPAVVAEQGFGVIPDVALKEKDWDSPFGICGHYQRYKQWLPIVGEVQQKLGIAWVRDEADWHSVIKNDLSIDPYLEYLNKHNICWLALFNYVNSYHGVQGSHGVWSFDEDVSMIKKYVELHKGHFQVYESQNEPNNFGGWSKRWPHPQKQEWRPQGWGKPFADLLIQMHDSIAAVDPSIQFMWPGEDEWIEYFVEERNAASAIDITSIHPYVNKSIYPETEKFAAGFYAKHKKGLENMNVPTEMWVTEIGWSTYNLDKEPERYVPVSEYEQAAFLVRCYLLHLYHGAKKAFWYEMNDEPFGDDNPESYFGIVRNNPQLTVKPSAVAFANMVKKYRFAVPAVKYKSDDTWGLAYRNKENKPQLCLWREKDEKPEVLPLTKTKSITVTDMFGRSKKLSVSGGKVTIPLGMYPLTITGIAEQDFENLYQQKKSPLSVIFDTDMGNDIDDALALDMLFKYSDQDKVRLLSIMLNKDFLYAPQYVDIMATWYGYPKMPIGVLKTTGDQLRTDDNNYTKTVSESREGRRPLYRRTIRDYNALPDAAKLYRKRLSEQPDHSVTIVSVGFSTNLARLLDTPADEYSSLTGKELVDAKVKLLSVMAGGFTKEPYVEYNVDVDKASARKVFAEWPSPIVVSPFELGDSIHYPGASIENDFQWAAHHPLVEAYKAYGKMPYNRSTWDLTAVLYAVEPEFFHQSPPGTITVDEAGHTLYQKDKNGKHSYLTATVEQRKSILNYFIQLITKQPAKVSPPDTQK
jgi:inosine-uridine nucleoside N-ribohydrolase